MMIMHAPSKDSDSNNNNMKINELFVTMWQDNKGKNEWIFGYIKEKNNTGFTADKSIKHH